MLRSSIAVGLLLAVSASALRAQTVIETSGGDFVPVFGPPTVSSVQTVGQTFRPPTNGDTRLSTFSVWLRSGIAGGGPVDLRLYVSAWGGDRAVGARLWESPTFSNEAPPVEGFVEFRFAPMLDLTPGGTFVAFLSASGLNADVAVRGVQDVGTTVLDPSRFPNGPYAEGVAVALANGDDTSQWTTRPWTSSPLGDLWFRAEFVPTVVPEPSTLALTLTGLGGMAGWVRHRRRRASPRRR